MPEFNSSRGKMVSLNNKAVIPTRLELDSEFRFRCHPGCACFTRCCRNIEILLTPYDVVRMKRRLGMSSTDFLKKYTRYAEDEKTTHPLLYLRMDVEDDLYCPFVTPGQGEGKGCNIYSDRPAACRYYPVGQATHRIMDEKNEEPRHDEWYMIVKEGYCLGFQEDKKWTVAAWQKDQDSTLYDDMNREWKNIMMKQDLPKADKNREKRQQMFYMASYDLDTFRRYVLESRFLEMFEVPPATLEKIKENDIELMKFSIGHLKYLLGISRELKLKPHVAEAQRARIAEMRAQEDADREARIAEAKRAKLEK